MIGFDENIILGSTDGEVIDTILGIVFGITLGFDVETYLGLSEGSFDGSHYDKIEVLMLGDSLGYIEGKDHGSDEGIKLELSDGIMFETVLQNMDGNTLEIDVGTDLGRLDSHFDGFNSDNIKGNIDWGLTRVYKWFI